LLAAAALSNAACGYQGPVQVTGLAFETGTRQLVYCEYFLPSEGGRTRVLYYNPQGYRFAEKDLYGEAGEQGANTKLPEMLQRDHRHGEVREVRRDGEQWLLRYRKSTSAGWKTAHRDPGEIDVIDAGFDAYVREYWDRLASGEVTGFGFASPQHGRSVELRAQRTECREPRPESLCLRVDLAQPLLRLFSDSLYLVYDTNTRRLRMFEGPVNILDSRARSQRLQVHYH